MSKTEGAYQTVRARILRGTYAPGQRLVLSSLAKELGISAVPLREAMRRLEAEGWVTFILNVGVEVRSLDLNEWVEVMEAFALVEGRATALAAPFVTREDVASARAYNAQMRAAMERMDPMGVTVGSQGFHRILNERCPNGYLRRLINEAADRADAMQHLIFAYTPGRTRETIEEHEQLLHLIEYEKDEGIIERYARQHKLLTVKAYLSAAGSAPALEGRLRPAAMPA